MEIKFKTFLRVWSSHHHQHPGTREHLSQRQQDAEDMAPKMYKHGEECVLYLLSFAQVWNDWDESKTKYLR